MASESMLRAWLSEMLSEVAVSLQNEKPATGPQPRVGLIAPASREVHDLPEDIRDTMDTLRLCIKYLVFDLQATQCDNRRLLRLLGQYRQQDGEA